MLNEFRGETLVYLTQSHRCQTYRPTFRFGRLISRMMPHAQYRRPYIPLAYTSTSFSIWIGCRVGCGGFRKRRVR